MIAVLWVDASGRVAEVNEAARRLLGPCVGRRCCDVVLARGDGRRMLCEPGCASELGHTLDRRGVTVQSRPCHLVCSRVGDHTVVMLEVGEAASTGVLTNRERQVLELVARGLATDEIAEALSIAASTARTHVERARVKLGARTRAEAVARAIQTREIAGFG